MTNPDLKLYRELWIKLVKEGLTNNNDVDALKQVTEKIEKDLEKAELVSALEKDLFEMERMRDYWKNQYDKIRSNQRTEQDKQNEKIVDEIRKLTDKVSSVPQDEFFDNKHYSFRDVNKIIKYELQLILEGKT